MQQLSKKINNWLESILLSHSRVWVLFLVFALIIRGLSFFFTIVDHDEWTYLIVSKEMFFHGKTLFVDVYDNKPPGIFILYGLFQFIPLPGIFVVRLMATIFIASTAWFLYRAKLQFLGSKRIALAVGFFYIFLISLFNWGLAANTEIFFVFFSCLALYLLTASPENNKYGYVVLAGFILGIAYIIKFVALFDFIALAIFWMFLGTKNNKISKIFLVMLATSVAFTIPFAFTHLWYYFNGHFNEFINATYTIPSRYITRQSFTKALSCIVRFHLFALPIVILFYISIYKNVRKQSFLVWKLMPLIWYLLAWFAVLLPGKYFNHYFVQLLIPVCFFAPDIFLYDSKIQTYAKQKIIVAMTSVLFIFILFQITYQYFKFWRNPDIIKEISVEINATKQPDDFIFTNYKNAIYYLCETEPPTKWIHTSLLFDPQHINAMQIDANNEIKSIIAKKPAYIVWNGQASGELADYLYMNMKLKNKFANGLSFYSLR